MPLNYICMVRGVSIKGVLFSVAVWKRENRNNLKDSTVNEKKSHNELVR